MNLPVTTTIYDDENTSTPLPTLTATFVVHVTASHIAEANTASTYTTVAHFVAADRAELFWWIHRGYCLRGDVVGRIGRQSLGSVGSVR